MNIKNIKAIMKSSLWKRITHDEGYRGFKVIDTYSLKHRKEGSFFVLLVFFEKDTPRPLLEHYLSEGRKIGSVGEGLDPTEIYEFYGTMRMLRFS